MERRFETGRVSGVEQIRSFCLAAVYERLRKLTGGPVPKSLFFGHGCLVCSASIDPRVPIQVVEERNGAGTPRRGFVCEDCAGRLLPAEEDSFSPLATLATNLREILIMLHYPPAKLPVVLLAADMPSDHVLSRVRENKHQRKHARCVRRPFCILHRR